MVRSGLRVVSLIWVQSSRSCNRLCDRHQARHAHQVVGRCDQVTRQLSASQSAIARSTETADGLHPAKDLLDALPDTLALAITSMPCRAAINGASPPAGVLRDVRRNAVLPHGRHTSACVIRLV